jgi:hypothetical protein
MKGPRVKLPALPDPVFTFLPVFCRFQGTVHYGARRFRNMPSWAIVLNEEQANAMHSGPTDGASDEHSAQQAQNAVVVPFSAFRESR